MKATIDIPDELYRQVKAKSALEGRPIRSVAVELFSRYVSADVSDDGTAARTSARADADSAAAGARDTPPWYGLAQTYARHVPNHGMLAIRDSIERGWAGEVADRETRLRTRGKG